MNQADLIKPQRLGMFRNALGKTSTTGRSDLSTLLSSANSGAADRGAASRSLLSKFPKRVSEHA